MSQHAGPAEDGSLAPHDRRADPKRGPLNFRLVRRLAVWTALLGFAGLLALTVLCEAIRRAVMGAYHQRLDGLARLADLDPNLHQAIGWLGLAVLLALWRLRAGRLVRRALSVAVPLFAILAAYSAACYLTTAHLDLGSNGMPRILQEVDPDTCPWFKSDGTPLVCRAEGDEEPLRFYRYQEGVKVDRFGQSVRPVQPGDWLVYQRTKAFRDAEAAQRALVAKEERERQEAERQRHVEAAALKEQARLEAVAKLKAEIAASEERARREAEARRITNADHGTSDPGQARQNIRPAPQVKPQPIPGAISSSTPVPRAVPVHPVPMASSPPEDGARAHAFATSLPLYFGGWRNLRPHSSSTRHDIVWSDRTVEIGIPPRQPVILPAGARLRVTVRNGEFLRVRQASGPDGGTLWILPQ